MFYFKVCARPSFSPLNRCSFGWQVTACMLAGLQEVHLITEPEAAALAFGLGRRRTGKSQQALAAAEADESKVERTLVVRVSMGFPL